MQVMTYIRLKFLTKLEIGFRLIRLLIKTDKVNCVSSYMIYFIINRSFT